MTINLDVKKIQRLWSLVEKRNDVALYESFSEIDFKRLVDIIGFTSHIFNTLVLSPPPVLRTASWQLSIFPSLSHGTRKNRLVLSFYQGNLREKRVSILEI